METGDRQVCIQCSGPDVPVVDPGAAQIAAHAQNWTEDMTQQNELIPFASPDCLSGE